MKQELVTYSGNRVSVEINPNTTIILVKNEIGETRCFRFSIRYSSGHGYGCYNECEVSEVVIMSTNEVNLPE